MTASVRSRVVVIVGMMLGGCALPPEAATAPAAPKHALVAPGGFRPDVLTRWIQGESVGAIASSLGVAPEDVRWMLIGSVRYARSRIGYERIAP